MLPVWLFSADQVPNLVTLSNADPGRGDLKDRGAFQWFQPLQE